ncbi:hypothetical protein V6N12_034921 [Hibiscus sabdariffa]|uniref:AAA+ ATPase domain-containing protein n=1 Tax=Hibiscus sabdariffa TaxID=183260 RepID=A0ABR2BNV3_9ROSI
MEAIATGAAANVSSEAAKGIFQEAIRHIRYVIFYQRYVDKFEDKLQKLIEKRSSVQQDIVVAERNVEKIKADVQGWCERVDKLIPEEEDKVKDLQVKAKNKCFSSLCTRPSIKSRYRLSRKAEEDAAIFNELIKECQFDRVGYRDVPQLIVHTDFETFKSRESVFSDIMESLNDTTVSMIGVYGMPGVGKTSLVREVHRQLQEVKLFNSVVMVTVSQTPDIQRIQDEIAESLGLKLEEKTTVVRARRLYERLIQEKNREKNQEKMILVILDDIWKKLDLEEVGIPFGSQHKGCRILLTSRNKNVVSNGMGATKTFQLGDLDDKEAWEFFKKMAGDSFESDEELRSTANELAQRCAGLPLAISTVARALQNKELFVWKDALRQLQRPYSENPSGISAEVYKAIELSFNQLPNDPLKQTFLICSLLRRDSTFEYLLRYTTGLGLINGVNTLEEARNNLLTKINYLKASCLLLHSGTDEKYFDVHDLTYIVAKSIASKDYQMFSIGKEDDGTAWPDGESMKKCNQFWWWYSGINKLPDQLNLNCPQLNHFLLCSKDYSLTLPADFFKEATNLKVLDLTGMQFPSLPSSIFLLTSLSTLCLDECKLGDDITIIGGLRSLEILSLLKSDIRILPKEIGQLVKLKLLDVSGSAKLKTISPGVLSCLTRLEELYMGGTSIQWGQSSTASLAELNTLSHLSTIEVQIPDAKAAPRDLFEGLQKLQRYKIVIGEEWEWKCECHCFSNYQYSRTINLRLSTGIDGLDRGFKKLLKKIEDLRLGELKGVKIALHELTDKESLSHLKNLRIKNGLDTEYIINGQTEFPQLQSLTLQNLPQLISFCPPSATSSLAQPELPLFNEMISFPYLEELQLKSINVTRVWHNQLLTTSFLTYEKLTTLKIEDCGSLKHLFSFSMAKCLVHLTVFKIIGCNRLREVIFMEEVEEETQATLTLFPQLKSIELQDLQHLIGFCFDSQTQVIEFPAMKSMTIENCPELEGFICASSTEGNQRISTQVLFDNKVAFPSLEEMSISYLRNMKTIWENSLAPNSFPKLRGLSITRLPDLKYIWKNDPKGIFSFKNLRQISVQNCWSLKNVFPASVARELPQLSELLILNCGVEEIVSNVEEESDSETTITFEFGQLFFLMLWRLPECKCFYRGRHTTNWPMLKELQVYKCGKMQIFGTQLTTHNQQLDSPQPLFLIEKVIPKLQRLEIGSDCIATICDGQFSSSLFHEIKAFWVEGGSVKSGDFQISFLERFNNLEELCISNCEIKELFCTEGDTDSDNKGMYAGPLTTVRKIKLTSLDNLKNYLWKQDVRLDHILPNLETLEVHECSNLMSLGSASASFQNLTTLDVWDCGAMKYLDTCLAVQGLSQLKTLRIRECVSVKEIVASEGDLATCQAVFNRLKSLELVDLPRLKSFCSGNHAFGFPCLEEVIVSGCPELEIFCKGGLNAPLLQSVEYEKGKGHWSGDLDSTVQHLHSTKVWYQGIRCLVLSEFSKSIKIWKEKSLDLKNLKVLEVEECNSLKYIFSVSMVLELVQLRDLKVNKCPKMEYIIKKGAEETAMDTVYLPKLNWIRLESCSDLKSFCMGSFTLKCPSLKTIDVEECNSLKYIFSVSMVLELVQLRDLKVKYCPKMEYIIKKGAEETAMDTVYLPKLNWIRLESCSDLKSFCMGSFTLKCPSLETIDVEECNSLQYIFDGCMAFDLVKLEHITVKNCPMMEYIIKKGAEEITIDTLPLPKLCRIKLESCSELKSFCMGSITLQCPSLYKIEVDYCPKMYAMASPREVGGGEMTLFFNDKVSCANLQLLTLKGCHNLEYLFPSSLIKSFVGLSDLSLVDCENVKEVIFTDESAAEEVILFTKLEMLQLIRLPKLGAFCHGDNSDTLFNQKVVFPKLTYLTIDSIGKCRKIWHGEATMNSFYELTYLWVKGCEGLLNILPLYMVERLEKLETLKIWGCGSLEEIIGPHDDDGLDPTESHTATTQSNEHESTTRFVFPNIQHLSLAMLPKLKGFYSKLHTTEWPSLKQLLVGGCSKVEIFAGEYINFQETQAQVQPLFWVTQEVFPNLKELYLIRNGRMKEIWHGPLPTQYFFNLTSLMLTDSPEASVNVPNFFIHSLPNLEKLSVERASLNGLFPTKIILGDEDEHVGKLANLKELSLSELSLTEVFCNLEILQALGCDKLKNLLPSSVSFKHLTTLQVSQCHGFRNLVTFTAAKSMVQLTRMTVTDCQMLEEIIASTTDEVTDDIFFSQLKSLELDCLPTLSRFCSGKYTLVFPSLEQVIIRRCPKIKFFTKGKLSTPMLHGLQSTEDEYVELWEGDLNVTLQQFVEKGIPSSEDLELSSISIQLVWKHKLLATHPYAQNLTCLTIEGCHNFNCLFSSSMVESFVHLKKLKVENCEDVENVIFVKGLTKEEMMNQKTFRVLEFLLLKDLPKLTRFCHANYFEFPLLTSLSIETCPTLKTFISDAEGNKPEIASPTLFDEKPVQVEEFQPKDTYYWKAIIEGKGGM